MFAKRKIRDDSGVAAIEFAFVMPVFLTLVLGTYWTSWAAHCMNSVRYGLAEGARQVQLNPAITQSALQTYVRNKTSVGNSVGTINVSLTFDPISGGTQLAHTTATYPVNFTIPFVGTYSSTFSVSITVPVIAS